MRNHAKLWLLALIGVIGAGAALRLVGLDRFPPGLHYDEAFNGLDALALSRIPVTEWPIFLTGNFGREPLFVYLLAFLHRLNDPSITTLRLVPALLAVLWTPAMAWLAWEAAPTLTSTPGDRDRRLRLAVWSAVALLGLFWGQIFARYAIRLSLFVLLEMLFFAALWRAWRVNRLGWWAVAGLCLGLLFYTYLPARLIPLALVPVMVVGIFSKAEGVAARIGGMGLGLLVAGLVGAPLLIYFWANPLSFTTRVGQTSLLAQSGWGGLVTNLRLVLAMFLGTGDGNIRANIPARPMLDWFMAGPFLAGLGLLVWRWRRPGVQLLLAAAVAMTLPTLLSDNAPHFQRAIGLLPWLALITALGVDAGVTFVRSRQPRMATAATTLGWALLLGSALLTTRLYFNVWAADPNLFAAWDVGFTQLADHLAQVDPAQPVYVSPRGSDHPTISYLLQADPTPPTVLGFDGRLCVRVRETGPADYIFLVNEDFRGPALLAAYLPEAADQVLISDDLGATWATQLSQPRGMTPIFPEMIGNPQVMADGIGLLGYWLSQDALHAGDRLYVRLFWRVTAQPSQAYTTFVHLLAQDADGETLLAGSDAPPGDGTCATPTWQPGEIIVDELQFVLPDPLPAAPLHLEVGLYTADGTRLTVTVGENPGADRILIGPLSTQN